MWDGEYLVTGFLLVGVHPRPEFLRVLALPRRKRKDLFRLRRIAAEKDIAMQIVAARNGGPFVADHCGENAGFVVFVRGFEVFLPDRFHDGTRNLGIGDRLGQCSLRLRQDYLVPGV